MPRLTLAQAARSRWSGSTWGGAQYLDPGAGRDPFGSARARPI